MNRTDEDIIYETAMLDWSLRNQKPKAGEIWALGDSRTYALAVQRGEEWPALLAETLGVEVCNLSILGLPVKTMITLYKTLIEKHGKPSQTLCIFSDTDGDHLAFTRIRNDKAYHVVGALQHRLKKTPSSLDMTKEEVLDAILDADRNYNKRIDEIVQYSNSLDIPFQFIRQSNITDIDKGNDGKHSGPKTHIELACRFRKMILDC
jgi:hypothetical protein